MSENDDNDTLLLTFYGDDVTGSTDAMDALARSGIETVLFLKPPDSETVAIEFPEAQTVGVAGTSRSMTPSEMDDALPTAFSALEELGAPLVHYKICSTFDSAPDIGSIGRAIDIAADMFEMDAVPIVPAAPPLGRYVVFGNMFASDIDDIYRLDRHPTMRDHPTTPIDESDLRRHLGKQTDRSMELVDILALQDGVETALDRFNDALADDPGIIVFDTLDETDAQTVGGVVWTQYAQTADIDTDRPSSSFVVGSSGFQYALADYWESMEIASESPEFEPLPSVDRLVVMSGSASPITANQIDAAKEEGFTDVRIDTAALVDPSTADREHDRVVSEALDVLDAGDSVVVYAARGPDDDAITATNRHAERLDESPDNVGRYIAECQGTILRMILNDAVLDRVVVTGGDTCGHVTAALDIYALQTRFPLAPGSPLCSVHANTPRFDGLEIALKGGQLGDDRYFIRARDGVEDW